MTESLDTASYVRVLGRICGVVTAWEEGAAACAPAWLLPVLDARRRRSMLAHDLAWFDAAETPDPAGPRPILPKLDTEASLLGAMYVMEGSTLGGQLIARHVTRVLGLSDGGGASFFQGHGDRTGPLWKDFCGILRGRVPDSDADAVIYSAHAMFQTFGTWMRQPDTIVPVAAPAIPQRAYVVQPSPETRHD